MAGQAVTHRLGDSRAIATCHHALSRGRGRPAGPAGWLHMGAWTSGALFPISAPTRKNPTCSLPPTPKCGSSSPMTGSQSRSRGWVQWRIWLLPPYTLFSPCRNANTISPGTRPEIHFQVTSATPDVAPPMQLQRSGWGEVCAMSNGAQGQLVMGTVGSSSVDDEV